MQAINVKVWDESKDNGKLLLYSTIIEGPFRVGRQDKKSEADQIGLVRSASPNSQIGQKLVIAFAEERQFSRNLAEVSFANDKIEICNVSNQVVWIGDEKLGPDQRKVVRSPAEISFLNRTLQLESLSNNQEVSIFSLPRETESPRPNQYFAPTFSFDANFSLMAATEEACIDSERLLELLQTMLQIFQDSPNSQPFFDQAALAMIQLLQLDHVLIAFHEAHIPELGQLLPSENIHDKWCYQAMHQRNTNPDKIGSQDWSPSSHIIEIVEEKKETVYQLPNVTTESLVNVNCLIVSPLLNSKNDLIGFIYGDRQISGIQTSVFSEAEAKFVELFANGISLGLDRLSQESEISEMRSRFDQFFTPELARQLESDAALLEPRSANVSVLFGDIRGFSRISERIGPEQTISWINSVMNYLSDCVFNHDGVVVDYIGDEILAMWGAPLDCEDHAELAVRAAMEMQARLPEINAEWETIIGETVEIGIGINSGEAQVGNIGSDRKFKYGPLGNVVNVASRVQSSTKQLGAQLLVTESTAKNLSAEIMSRKIRSVRFVNVERPVCVYEIPVKPAENWIQLKEAYETGLELYARGELREASQQMASVINRFPEDGPSVHLLSDSVANLSKDGKDFDPVWTLGQK